MIPQGPLINSVTRDAAFSRLGFTSPLHHAHFSAGFGASRCFLLLFAYFQCILGSRHAQILLFATASRSKVFFDLSLPLVTCDATYERPLRGLPYITIMLRVTIGNKGTYFHLHRDPKRYVTLRPSRSKNVTRNITFGRPLTSSQ